MLTGNFTDVLEDPYSRQVKNSAVYSSTTLKKGVASSSET
jgi:hypothetical protein